MNATCREITYLASKRGHQRHRTAYFAMRLDIGRQGDFDLVLRALIGIALATVPRLLRSFVPKLPRNFFVNARIHAGKLVAFHFTP